MTNRMFCGVTLLAVLGMLGIVLAPSSLGAEILSDRMLALHLLMELVAVWVATLVVVVSWTAFGHDEKRVAQTLMAGFVVVAVADLMHTFTFVGMPSLFGEASVQRSIFFWLAGRTAEVITLGLVACAVVPRISHAQSVLVGIAGAGAVLWLGGPALHLMPQTFVPGIGLTPFKVGYEIVLGMGNFAVAALLWRSAAPDQLRANRLMALSCVFMGLAGFAFASYSTPSDFQNFAGHIYKVVAYLLLYQGIFIRSQRAPYEVLARSEAALRASRERLAALDINMPGSAAFRLVKQSNGQKRFTEVSASFAQVLMLDPATLLVDADAPIRMIHPDDLTLIAAAERHSEETLEPTDVQARFLLPDGQTRMMRIATAPRRNHHGEVIWDGLLTDVTERYESDKKRRETELQLLHAQKMESIGTMASGIAHDFNNLLVVIMGNARLALADAHQGATREVIESLDQVIKAGARAQGVVKRIMSLGRQDSHERLVRTIEPVVQESLSFVRSVIPSHIDLRTDIREPGARAEIDEVQLQQVLINLCNNAAHAIDSGTGRSEPGRIVVSLDVIQLGAHEALPQGLYPGPHVRISVQDNGCGMSDETRRRIFEPFFTTKSAEQGTGLGLSMVHGIIQSHAGAVGVVSKLGEGTRFDVLLPAISSTDVRKSLPTAGSGRHHPQGAKPRVLYIDDDAVMGTLVSKLLEASGFDVTVSNDPKGALTGIRRDPHRYSLVVTDYNMPGCTGLDVAQELQGLVPAIPCVMVSGFASDALRDRARRLDVMAVLARHQALDELVDVVTRALDMDTATP